jgi:DNA-binding CsgD family transcriptional regulator
MPRLSKDHARALAELRSIAGRPLSPTRLGNDLIAALERAIGWDGYRLFGVDSRTLLINRLISASDNDRAARREWLEEVYLDDRTLPYLRLQEIARARLRAVAYQPTQEQSWGYPLSMMAGIDPAFHRRYYIESESPIGGTLHATFESNGRQLAVLQAYRRDANANFRQKDVALMQLASPVVGQALGASLAREHAMAERGESVPSGIVLVGPNRTIDFSTPAGDEWLAKLRAAEPGNDTPLPAAVWSAVKGLAQQSEPALRIVTMTPGGPVDLEASAGGNGATAIVVSAHRPEPRIEPPEHWGLTAQQGQIAMHVIGGASNREIADRLFLSEHTVEWHLRQIYRTLDLSSRTQLQARFFRDVGLGAYQDPPTE